MDSSWINKAMKGVLIFSAVAALSACARYPLDMSKEEWNALPPDLRYVARQEQAALDRARSEERRAAYAAREREAQAQEDAYRQALANAPYGSRVSCLIEGEAYLSGKWRTMDSVLFELMEDHPIKVPLRTLDRRYQTDGNAEFNGHRVSFCDRLHGLSRQPNKCGVLSGTRFQYARGKGVRFHADQFMRGIMYCEYAR